MVILVDIKLYLSKDLNKCHLCVAMFVHKNHDSRYCWNGLQWPPGALPLSLVVWANSSGWWQLACCLHQTWHGACSIQLSAALRLSCGYHSPIDKGEDSEKRRKSKLCFETATKTFFIMLISLTYSWRGRKPKRRKLGTLLETAAKTFISLML